MPQITIKQKIANNKIGRVEICLRNARERQLATTLNEKWLVMIVSGLLQGNTFLPYQQTNIIVMDFSKAFDEVEHNKHI